ncbi:hypothetical protein Tco_0398374 [Tanacetum coccineum]
MVASEVAKPRRSGEHASPPYPTLLAILPTLYVLHCDDYDYSTCCAVWHVIHDYLCTHFITCDDYDYSTCYSQLSPGDVNKTRTRLGPDLQTRIDWGIPELTGDGDGDGESPNYEIWDGAGLGITEIPGPGSLIPIGDRDGDVNRFPDGDGDGDGDEAKKRGWGWG